GPSGRRPGVGSALFGGRAGLGGCRHGLGHLVHIGLHHFIGLVHGFLHRAQSGVASGHSGFQSLRSGLSACGCVLGQVFDQGFHGRLGLTDLALHHLADLTAGVLGDVKQLAVVGGSFLGQRLKHLRLQRQQLLRVTHRHQGFGVVLGVEIAHQMGVRVGDRVTLVAPGGQVTPAGVLPRLKQLEVLGLIDTGHYEFDATLAVMQIDDAQRLLRLEGPNGLRLKLRDAQQARVVASELSLQIDPLFMVRDWTRQNRNWFAAVQIEKRMMFIILTLIVAVAAFNLVSTLVMTVTDKQSDIAILRTLGASPASIMGVFMVQGALVGVVGTLSGLLLGLVVAFNIDVIVPAIEQALGLRFLPQDIYLISRMPSDPQLADIGPVVVLSLLLALLATLYPSWRASRVQPAEALRYE
ncbi:MAG: hypothetical protein RLZZ395_1167, partial [Pseudomonadota bacterium]